MWPGKRSILYDGSNLGFMGFRVCYFTVAKEYPVGPSCYDSSANRGPL